MADWKLFAWQGILMEVPESWNLGAAQGDKSSGYLRLDDGEMVRVEMKWEKEKSTPDLSKIVSNYLSALEKAARKRRAGFWSKREMRLGKLGDREHEYFMWREEVQGYGLALRCAECKRVLFARVQGKRGEGIERTAMGIFSTLQDHQEGDEELWKFYDFGFRVPADFKLDRSSLRAGLFEMAFSRGSEALEFTRQGVADFILKGRTPAEWFLSFQAKKLRAFAMGQPSEGPHVMGHLTAAVEGEKKLIRRVASAFAGNQRVRCIVWKCDRGDKLLGVRAVAAPGEERLCDKAAASVVCHEES